MMLRCVRAYPVHSLVHARGASAHAGTIHHKAPQLSTPVHCRFLLCVKRATMLTYPRRPRLCDRIPAHLPDALCVCQPCDEHVDTDAATTLGLSAHCKSIIAWTRRASREVPTPVGSACSMSWQLPYEGCRKCYNAAKRGTDPHVLRPAVLFVDEMRHDWP